MTNIIEQETPKWFAIEADFFSARASEQPEKTTNARELWLAMTPAEQKQVIQSQPNSIERFYREKLGISEVELCIR